MRCRLVTLGRVLRPGVGQFGLSRQGAATTSTIPAVVVDSAGRCCPRRGSHHQTQCNRASRNPRSATRKARILFPSLPIGTYTVTVTLQGFKTFVVNDVVLTAGSPASVRAVLEVGGVEEQVLVSSRSEIVQTQSTVISSTINANQIMKLPITQPQRARLRRRCLPGVTTAGGNRQSQINGLPRGVDQHHARRREHPGQHAAEH